jgi:hypothetical protein
MNLRGLLIALPITIAMWVGIIIIVRLVVP